MTTPVIASDISWRTASRSWYEFIGLRVVVLAATFTAFAAYEMRQLLALANNDIWWHLRTGLWILENHTVPADGIFSQSAARPWVDASWGFDVLAALFYRLGGLAGLPVFFAYLQVAIAVALFALALGASRRFWPAIALAAVAQFCLAPLQPRPALCSTIFLAIELALLLRARRTGDYRALYWLPLVFLLWVTLDKQFSYGLLVLALFCIAVAIEHLGRPVAWFESSKPKIRLSTLAAVALVSFLATFVSPYTWHLHALLWQGATSTAADRYFRELHSMRFREPQDYLLMLLAMTAFFALGRRRSRDLFLISLLAVSAVISFRIMRDNWFVVVCSVAIIGDALQCETINATTAGQSIWRRGERLVATVLVLVVVVIAVVRFPGWSNVHEGEQLLSSVEDKFPVGAADYIRQNHLPQPLFNSLEWGGFLTWYLPEYPVSIDGRSDLYGDDRNVAYFKLMLAEVPLQSDSTFTRAQTILLEANSPIAQALRSLPDFREVYRDKVAVVLVRGN